MRVDTTHPTGDDEHGSGEQGAVAIVVAVCLIVLLGLSSFAVDFGLAYSETRQVQTAADAAAVAAASAYAEESGNCGTILASLGTSAGENAGRAVFEQNHVTPDWTSDIRCDDAGVLRARWTAGVTTDTTLARAMPGAPDQLTSERTAEAILGVPGSYGEGMRPFMLCSEDAPSPTESFPTKIRRTSSATNGNSDNPLCPEPPGAWWTFDCPTAPSGWQIRDGITQGCPGPVAPSSTPFTFADCPPTNDPVIPAKCLSGETGAISPGGTAPYWRALIDDEVEFQMPVFGTARGTGTNAEFTIRSIVTVQMCGYHHGNEAYPSSLPVSGVCSASNMPTPALPPITGVDGNKTHFFYLVYKRVNYTNTVVPSGCQLGDVCDVGARSVFMVD